MSFDTAIRNPERYLGILRCIKEYEGKILNDENLLIIVSNLYINKEVNSKEIIIDENSTISNISDRVKKVNSSRKADGGYPKGYPARFWTYVRTLSELGFIYAQYNEKLEFSEIANELLNGNIDEQEAFLIQMIRTNRKSPYRNVLNDFNFFIFIIEILIELKKVSKKMSYNEFVLSTFWKNDDKEEFLRTIDKEKNNLKNNLKTYEYIKNNFSKVNIEQTVMKDYPDVVLRLLRITGLITITSHISTIYLEINENLVDFYRELKNYYSEFKILGEEKKDKKNYFYKIGSLENSVINIIKKYRRKEFTQIDNYNKLIKNIVEKYKLDEKYIINHLKKIDSAKIKEIPAFKGIQPSIKFEFYISIFIYLVLGEKYNIRPNYKMDSNGIPISHAPGNKGDIEVYTEKIYWILEVSLMRNRMQQYNNETTNLIRHLNSKEDIKENYLSFVAPYVHEDTQRLFDALIITLKIQENMRKVNARAYNLDEFIKIVKEKDIFKDMKNYSKEKINELKEKI